MDHPARIARVQAAMAERGIDLLFVPYSSDAAWLAGLRHERPGPTITNRPGDTIAGLYLPVDRDPMLVATRMGGGGVRADAAGKPWIRDVFVLNEPVNEEDGLRAALGHLRGPVTIGITERAWAASLLAIGRFLPDARFVPASELILNPLRAVKDADEIAAMRRVAALTDEVYAAITPQLRPGITEREVAEEIWRQGRLRGAEEVSFPTAVLYLGGSSRRGYELPSYSDPLDLPLERGMGIAFDFGFILDRYCSDFGRTVFVGEPDPYARKIYDLAIGAQADAIAAMRAGASTAAEVDRVARAQIEAAGHGPDFIHRLGHAIGRDCHEWPSLNVGEGIVLQAGMAFTVEPSVHLQGTAYVRIEDVAIVTPDGGDKLMSSPRELLVVGE
jgi:Xaa-Pro aminopeptidase